MHIFDWASMVCWSICRWISTFSAINIDERFCDFCIILGTIVVLGLFTYYISIISRQQSLHITTPEIQTDDWHRVKDLIPINVLPSPPTLTDFVSSILPI
jgi:hypothetical protein